MHVLESRTLPDGGKRVRLSLTTSPAATYGWVTAITKSGLENIAPYVFEVIAAKPLLVRQEYDVKSEKLGEIAPGTLVFVLESRESADGSQRTQFAFATPSGGMSPGGWVTSLTKDGTENLALAQRGKRQAPDITSDPDAPGRALQSIVAASKASGKPEVAAAAVMLAAKAAAVAGKGAAGGLSASAAAVAATLAAANGGTGGTGGGKGASSSRQPKERKSASSSGAVAAVEASKTPRGGAEPKPPSAPGANPKGGGRKEAPPPAPASSQRNEEAELAAKREEVRKAVAEAREALSKLVSKKVFEDRDFKYVRTESHRPAGRPDEMPSRHAAVPSCGMLLMFNCNRASFELHMGDLSTLPEVRATRGPSASALGLAPPRHAVPLSRAARSPLPCPSQKPLAASRWPLASRTRALLACSCRLPPPASRLPPTLGCQRSDPANARLAQSEAIDIKSVLSSATVGRVKIAPEKNTPFVERVEFPNEWKFGDEHGLEHNGLQVPMTKDPCTCTMHHAPCTFTMHHAPCTMYRAPCAVHHAPCTILVPVSVPSLTSAASSATGGRAMGC